MPHGLDPSGSAPMTSIVRVAIAVVTIALFVGSTVNAMNGQRDLAIAFALATPLGISAWGFARGGHNEPALALLACVSIVVVTLVLVMSPLGVHDPALAAYGGIVLLGALLLSRRAFLALAALAVFGASLAFILELNGLTRNRVGTADWMGFAEFLVIFGVFAILGRYCAEVLFGRIGAAAKAHTNDPLTALANRTGFLEAAGRRLKSTGTGTARRW